MATLAFLVVVVAGASVGQSALGGAGQSGILVSGTTDTVTNLDPAGNYDYGSFAADVNIYEQLMGFKNGAKLQPVLATKCFAVGGNKAWRLQPEKGRHVPRRVGVRLRGREVLRSTGSSRSTTPRGSRRSSAI